MKFRRLFLACLFACTTLCLDATDRSTGAVLKEDHEAEVGFKPGKKIVNLKAGTFLAFMKMSALEPKWGEYKSEGGRIRAVVIQNNDRGNTEFVWLPEDKLELFTFDTNEPNKSPHQVQNWKPQWTLAFKAAARAKCKELGIAPANPAYVPQPKTNK